jgi:hypothetical protein
MSIYNDTQLITPQGLKELGFTVKESTYRGAIYNFPDNLEHGGYTLEIQDRHTTDLMPGDHIVMVFDGNGVGQPETMETIGHIRFLLSSFRKK